MKSSIRSFPIKKGKSRHTVESLKAYEEFIGQLFSGGQIMSPVHLCSGNEAQLIKIFRDIRPEDWVIASHRNHYHAILKEMNLNKMTAQILKGRSMTIADKDTNFFSTGIVCAGPAIAVGIALALKRDNQPGKVWCFVGDGAEDQGRLVEAVRYAEGYDLPIQFVVEDNDLSVETGYKERWKTPIRPEYNTPFVFRYRYTRKCPHVGIGYFVKFF